MALNARATKHQQYSRAQAGAIVDTTPLSVPGSLRHEDEQMDQVMMAAVLTRHGGADALEVRRDWPVPTAGSGEVLVRVGATAVNNTDIWTREGAYGLPGEPDAKSGWRGAVRFPRIQGGDIAGLVVVVGADVPADLLGRRVLVDPAIYRDDSGDAPPVGLLGSEADGGFATYVVVAAAHAHDVSDSPLSDEELACLPVAYGTAMGMLERAALRAGETVLVTGASGGVGLALVQLAVARGADVVAVTSRAKASVLRDAGAAHVVSRDVGDLAEQVTTAVPAGLDAVADVAGGAGIAQLMPLLRDDGRWVIAGAVAGPIVSFDLRRLYLHNRRLIGSSMHTREHFAKLVALARTGSIRPRIAGRHTLANIHQAQQRFLEGRHVGKIVITP
jgi:NADPH:quinone reductase-like Zn-dependent oxidoreductase